MDLDVLSRDQIIIAERRTTVQCYGSRAPNPVVVRSAKGVRVTDVDGREYLDFTAQTAAGAIGYGDPRMTDALARELSLPAISPNHIHPARVALAERLVNLTGGSLDRVYFGVSGSDAIDAALKFARKRTGRWKVISHWNGYHGTTFGALSAHGIPSARQPYEPLLPGFIHVPPPDPRHNEFGGSADDLAGLAIDHVRRTIDREGGDQIGAITIEPVFAGGGVIVPPPEYLAGLRRLCDDHGILLIFDEVVTGIGRTGTMFAYESIGVLPDMVVLGKGLTGGYQALSAVLMRSSVDPFDASDPDEPLHLHTMAANPMGCVAALTTLAVIESDRLLDNTVARGRQLLDGLRGALESDRRVVDVRGKGLLVGIELAARPGEVKSLERRAVTACRDLGLLVYGSSGPHAVIVLHPPLVVTQADVDAAIALLSKAIAGVDQ